MAEKQGTPREISPEEAQCIKYAVELGEGLPGAVAMLIELYQKLHAENPNSDELFYEIASQLGRGVEIWEKYDQVYKRNLDLLIEMYRPKEGEKIN